MIIDHQASFNQKTVASVTIYDCTVPADEWQDEELGTCLLFSLTNGGLLPVAQGGKVGKPNL